MKSIAACMKMIIYCVLVSLGAVVLLTILPVVAMLLMTGPLLALAGLVACVSLAGVVAAIVFAGPPTAVSSGLTVSAIVRDGTN